MAVRSSELVATMNEKNYFEVITRVYDVTGLRKSSKNLRKSISMYVLFPLAGMLYVMTLMNFKFKSGDLFGIIEVFEAVSTFGQHFIRKLTVTLYSDEIEEVIGGRAKFWKVNSFDNSFTAALYKKLRFGIIQIKIFWFSAFLVTLMLIVTPLFIESVKLPSSCWMPFDNKFFYAFIYFLQSLTLVEIVFMTAPTDAFFLFMCKDLEIQLQLIGRTLKDIHIDADLSDEYQEECLTKLKQCSNHHGLLLKLHSKVGKIFSIYFILQFLINVAGNTIQFYVLSLNGSDLVTILKCLSYVMVVLIQDSISFVSASNVEIEAENLANDIYGVDWYNTPNMKIRKFILFWLMRAQEPLEMSGGGLMKINRNVFLQIPKTSFSIYTLLN